MRLIGRNIIAKFMQKHSTSRKSLNRWVELIEGSEAKKPQDLKDLFGQSNLDIVGNQTIFDIGGNKIRAITKIQFGVSVVQVTHILTHAEYDKNKWKE